LATGGDGHVGHDVHRCRDVLKAQRDAAIGERDEAVFLLKELRAGSFGYFDRIDAFLAGQAEETKP
jgi:hypothetical protein